MDFMTSEIKTRMVSYRRSSVSDGGVAATLATLAVLLAGLSSCGGGSSPADPPLNLSAQQSVEAGAALKIVAIPGAGGAVDALFPDGEAYYSPDGYNVGGGGSTIAAYTGSLQVLDIVAVATGVDALLSDGSVVFSPDGQNLGGGGASALAYQGSPGVAGLAPVGGGVDVIFSGSAGVIYSPDGRDFSGGKSVSIYSGGLSVLQVVPMDTGNAVLTLLENGAAYYSPDNKNLAGGGATVAANSASAVVRVVKVGGGVLAQFQNGAVYLSPTGLNLDGGNGTISVASWNSLGNGPFPARDSAHGAEFLGHLWVSGGFSDATNTDSCFSTCSFFDLWSSTDALGASWNSQPSFATASQPDPRDATATVNNGVMDVPPPTDFYDSYSAIVVWNSQLTAIGATVWRSADGTHWARDNLADGVTATPGPALVRATENSRAVIVGGVLYFLQPDSGEVYRSTDATASQWTDLGAIPSFTPRCGPAVFVLEGRMWIVGGGACDYSAVYNDVWSSADGVNWTQSPAAAAWSARMWPCVATSTDGVVWLGGGYAPTDWNNYTGTVTPRYGANHSDLWYSKNGTDWKQFKADDGSGLSDDGVLEPRHAPTCFVTGSTPANYVIMAGTGGTDPNDANARVINSIRSLQLPPAATLP
jgi:hypothetical protein